MQTVGTHNPGDGRPGPRGDEERGGGEGEARAPAMRREGAGRGRPGSRR